MQSKPNKNTQKDDSQLSNIIAGYLSYWPLFLICMLLTSAGAYFYILRAIPLYQANATVIIKDERKGEDYSKQIEAIDMINTKKIIENETEVFQSRILMEQVVKKLHLYAPIIIESKFGYISAYESSPVIAEVKDPDHLKIVPDNTLEINFDSSSQKIKLDNKYSGNLNEWITTPTAEIRFSLNPNYVRPELPGKIYLYFVAIDDVTSGILKNLKAEPSSKLSSVLELSYKDDGAKKAEDVLNTLIDFYGAASVAEKNDLIKNTIASIDSRLANVKSDLDSIEKKIQLYKASNKAVDLTSQANLYLQSVGSSDIKQGEVDVQLSNLDELEKYVKSNENIGVLPSAIGITDPTLNQLMTNLSTAQANYDKLKKTVGEGNPMMLSLKEEVNKIKPEILANIQTQKRNLSTAKQSLSSTSGKYSSLLNYIPQQEKQLLEISRDQNIKNGIYSFLLQKREESQLSYASNISESKVVNYALADRIPVSPKKLVIFVAALLLGLIIPVVIVEGREMLNSKILYRKEIENLTAIPVIGEIVHNKSKKDLVIEPGKRSFIAEEFRKIRVSLLFLGIDAYHKKILVTSSIPGEGKSFVSVNLAISLAMTGKKVVLIDMDLHDPSLSKMLDVATDEPGVSDFLMEEKKLEDIIIKMPSVENLFFIPAGFIHSTPSELLENGQLQYMIDALDNSFDVIVMDTAPIIMVTDAYHLSGLADATLFVIRHKYTPKMLVKRIDENNKVNSLKNPAIIFNGVKNRGYTKNNYGYGYDYVYGGKQKKTKEKKVKA